MTLQHPEYEVAQVAQVAQVHQPAEGYTCSCGRSFDTPRGLRTHQGHLRRDGWDTPANEWRAHLTVV